MRSSDLPSSQHRPPNSSMYNMELPDNLQYFISLHSRGDYRTGKRLNMRRIIPYIASYFQNDQIWLRRTKPSKREYQVLMAVDDSASMNENQCSQVRTQCCIIPCNFNGCTVLNTLSACAQMAYESLAMISSALNRLECGQVGILR